jgi:two-component system, chemotaxis family, protein-glutamate methylesterase/glutaminase
MEKIKVLVVDDSAFMRKVIPQMLQEDGSVEVIGTAKNGPDAFKKTIELNPDVITLDVEMPGMDGLKTLGMIMSEKPTPVIMLSAYTPKGAEITMQALEYGAVDFVCKPSGEISLDIKKVQSELIEKIKAAKNIDMSKLAFVRPEDKEEITKEKQQDIKLRAIVCIASSTGGPRALTEVIPKITKRNMPAAYLVVQHMSEGFTATLASRLNSQSMIKVKEGRDGEEIKAGTVYLAPGNFHMEILGELDGMYHISLNQKPLKNGVRPAADYTMASVAERFKGRTIGVILTGMGKDGAEGAEKIKKAGGTVIAQDKDTCVIYGMPKVAAERGVVDIVAPLDRIAFEITGQIEKE